MNLLGGVCQNGHKGGSALKLPLYITGNFYTVAPQHLRGGCIPRKEVSFPKGKSLLIMGGKRKYEGESKTVKKHGSSKTTQRLKKASLARKFGTKNEVSPEVKFIDTSINSNTSSTGVVALLNGVVEGTDAINRIGRKIEMSSMEYKLKFAQTAGVLVGYPDGGLSFRMAIVYDRQPNAAALAWTDVFDQNANVLTPYSGRNINNLDRFEVLAQEFCVISSGGPNNVIMSRYVKMSHDVRFNAGNAGTIADITSGALFCIFADDNNTGANFATLFGRIRVRFHDM